MAKNKEDLDELEKLDLDREKLIGEENEDRTIVKEDDDGEEDEDKEESLKKSDEDESQSGDEDPKREQRRKERREAKERQREARERKDRKLRELEADNADMRNRLAKLEGAGAQAEVARLEEAISQTSKYIESERTLRKKAMEEGDADAIDAHDDNLYKARRLKERLDDIKASQGRTPKTSPALDPTLKRHAKSFNDDHSWYDPSGKDEDSKIVYAIDTAVFEDGFDPKTTEYWDELRKRIRRRLPHRFEKKDDEGDEPPRRGGGGPPVGGKGSGGGSNSAFHISSERRKAMIEAGYTEGSKQWKDMVDSYRKYDADLAKENRR